MTDKKIIAVLGATGAQGGGLVRAIKEDPGSNFTVRAITRNAGSEKAKALAGIADEIVEASTDDPESLEKAFQGAYGVFGLTNFWDHFSADRETQQARNIAQAAQLAGVEHVVWSTLEDSRNWIPLDDDRMPTLQEKYKVPHFDSKGQADHFFTDFGVPTTFLLTSFYWDNFIFFGANPKPGADGVLELTMPIGSAKFPGIAVSDIGKSAYTIFRNRDTYLGQRVGISGEQLTGEEMARQMSEAFGREVRFNNVPADVYRGFGFPGADDMGNMFQFNSEFSEYFCGIRDPEKARELNPEMQTFKDWLGDKAGQIPLE